MDPSPSGLIIPPEFSNLKVDQVAVNANGTMVSVLVSSKEHATEGKMFVYCSETNATVMFDFGKVMCCSYFQCYVNTVAPSLYLPCTFPAPSLPFTSNK